MKRACAISARPEKRAKIPSKIRFLRSFIYFSCSFIKKLFKEALTLTRVTFSESFRELLEQFFLLRREIFRCFNHYGYNEVALALRVYIRNTLTLEGESRSGLSSFGDLVLLGLVAKHGNVYLCAESRL